MPATSTPIQTPFLSASSAFPPALSNPETPPAPQFHSPPARRFNPQRYPIPARKLTSEKPLPTAQITAIQSPFPSPLPPLKTQPPATPFRPPINSSKPPFLLASASPVPLTKPAPRLPTSTHHQHPDSPPLPAETPLPTPLPPIISADNPHPTSQLIHTTLCSTPPTADYPAHSRQATALSRPPSPTAKPRRRHASQRLPYLAAPPQPLFPKNLQRISANQVKIL